MRKVIARTFVSLDGVMQAPGGPKEDPTRGFKLGGWVAQSRTISIRSSAGGSNLIRAAAVAALAVACTSIVLLSLPGSPLARHMVLHALLMNAAAPVIALLVVRSLVQPFAF